MSTMSLCTPMEQTEFYSFGVQYMGSAIIPQTATGLKTLQKPLKDLYCSYQRPTGPVRLRENLLTITDTGLIVSRLMVGEVGDYATGAEVTHEMSSIQFWDAVQFVTVKEKEKKYRCAFEPLNNDQNRNRDNLFFRLDFKHEKHLTNIPEHPVLFVITLRRKSGLKVLDLHAFICSSDNQAISITQNMNTVNGRFMKEETHHSSMPRKGLFGKSKKIPLSPSVASMNNHVYVNQMPNPQRDVDGNYTTETNKPTKKKRWGFSRKSNMTRSASVDDINDVDISVVVPRLHDLTKGDFVHTRSSRDTRCSQGYLKDDSQDKLDFSNKFGSSNSLHTMHSSAIELRPQGSTADPFYVNGKQNKSSADRPEVLQKTDRREVIQKTDRPEVIQKTDRPEVLQKADRREVIQKTDRPEVIQKTDENQRSQSEVRLNQGFVTKSSLLQNDQFINMRGLGGGKTYRVYENTPRDNKQVDNVVGEKFRRFDEEREAKTAIVLNQKYKRNFERGRGKETKITPTELFNSKATSTVRAQIIEISPWNGNRQEVQGGHEPLHSSMSKIDTDPMPLALYHGSQSLPVENSILKLEANCSPSYRRKFPTPKTAGKTNPILPSPKLPNSRSNQILPSPKLSNKTTIDPVSQSQSTSSNNVKPLPQIPQIKVSESSTKGMQSNPVLQETSRLNNKIENDNKTKKNKPVPMTRKSVVENRPSPFTNQTVNENSVNSQETPRGVINKPIAFVQPRKVLGVRVLPIDEEDINVIKSQKSRASKTSNDRQNSFRINEQRSQPIISMSTSGSDVKDRHMTSTAGSQRFDGTFYTRTNLETSLGYLP